jgi:hypothetical protein
MYNRMASGVPRAKPCTLLVQAKPIAPDERPSGATSPPKVGAFIHGHPAGGGTAAGREEPSKALMMTDGALNF